jgi:glycosidase
VVYEYENGVKCFSNSRQMRGTANDVTDHVMGTRGRVDVMRHRIIGDNPWAYPAAQAAQDVDMYQQEHNELFASIRRGQPINDGDWMAKSTLMAIMGRMACYTGQVVTWDQAMNSREDLTPPSYRWDQPMPEPEVARPGITRLT